MRFMRMSAQKVSKNIISERNPKRLGRGVLLIEPNSHLMKRSLKNPEKRKKYFDGIKIASKNISTLRNALGISGVTVKKLTSIHIEDIESGDNDYLLSSLEKLSKIFATTSAQLLTAKQKPESEEKNAETKRYIFVIKLLNREIKTLRKEIETLQSNK